MHGVQETKYFSCCINCHFGNTEGLKYRYLTVKITLCGFMLLSMTQNMKCSVMLKLLSACNSRQSDQTTTKHNSLWKCIRSACTLTGLKVYWTKCHAPFCKAHVTHIENSHSKKETVLETESIMNYVLLTTPSFHYFCTQTHNHTHKLLCVCVCVSGGGGGVDCQKQFRTTWYRKKSREW